MSTLANTQKEQKQRKKEGCRALNNVILGRGNTRASEDLHFPQVEATVDVHLVLLVLRKIEKKNPKTIILLLTETRRASSEVPGRGPTEPVSFLPLQRGNSMAAAWSLRVPVAGEVHRSSSPTSRVPALSPESGPLFKPGGSTSQEAQLRAGEPC